MNMKFSGVKKILKSKTLIGSMLFAFALWGYTSFNKVYIAIVDVPLNVSLPPTRALEEPLPATVSVQVKGLGWNLFDLYLFNTAARCNINLSNNIIDSTEYHINEIQIIKSLEYFKNIEAIDVFPKYITLKTGVVVKKRVPIKPNLVVIPRDGFTVVGKIEFEPDTIEVIGNQKIISHILEWKTTHLELKDVHSSLVTSLALYDTLKNVVKISPNIIKASVNVQQIAEIVILDVPLSIEGNNQLIESIKNSLYGGHRLYPLLFHLTIRGGLDVISKTVYSQFKVKLKYHQILNDTTGVLIPEIEAPENVAVIKVEPPYVFHIKQTNIFTLSQLLP